MVVDFSRDVYCLLGLPFDAIDMRGAIQRVQSAAVDRQACFLSTPNLNFLIGCQADSKFRDSVINSDMSVVDGMPLVWIARLLGIPIRERVPGSTLFEELRKSSGLQLSVFFFGGPDGVAKSACQQLQLENRGLTCVGYESPGFGTIEEISSEEIICRINASKADFLVVALGAKKGQAWIERNRARVTVPVISHLGAVVNFVAGTVNRAPVWMQRTGLEWAWRIKEEPALWRRYFVDGLAMLTILVTRVLPFAWYLRCHKPRITDIETAAAEMNEVLERVDVKLNGAWTLQNIVQLRTGFCNAILAGKNIQLDLSAVTYVDSAFVGIVTLLHGYQKRQSKKLFIISASPPVRKVITYCCADYLFIEPENG